MPLLSSHDRLREKPEVYSFWYVFTTLARPKYQAIDCHLTSWKSCNKSCNATAILIYAKT